MGVGISPDRSFLSEAYQAKRKPAANARNVITKETLQTRPILLLASPNPPPMAGPFNGGLRVGPAQRQTTVSVHLARVFSKCERARGCVNDGEGYVTCTQTL